MLWEWRRRDACAVEMGMWFNQDIMKTVGSLRVTQGYVTLQSHIWMRRKRGRVGIKSQERRENRKEET